MCWPSTVAYDGSGAYLESVQEALGRLAAAIAVREPVTMLADAASHGIVARCCGPDVSLLDVPTDDMWARDTAPSFVSGDSGLALIDFNFNGWGGKQQHGRDQRVAAEVATATGCRRLTTPIVGEGGGLEVDGDGTLIAAESSWVNTNRNPGASRYDIEKELKRLTGAHAVIWVPGLRDHEITDWHIDGAARFVRPGLLLVAANREDTSAYGDAQRETRAILSCARDARGRAFEIVEIEDALDPRSSQPDFYSGYTNYYLGNAALYTPQFGDRRADRSAFATLQRLFPDRQVVALDLDRIYENGGGAHCVTQQELARLVP
jgi:agmatine deiminase